jgi:uncharacterized membrane protein YphA (DoxX/SURF4 family)
MRRFWEILYLVVRIALGLVFIAAAAPKIWRPDEFADAINNYRLIPYFLVNISAIALPWVEMLFGVFLVFGFRVKAASLATTCLLAVFLAAIISAWARHIDISCGCFGTGKNSAPISWHEVVRDSLFLAMSVFTYIRPSRLWTPKP